MDFQDYTNELDLGIESLFLDAGNPRLYAHLSERNSEFRDLDSDLSDNRIVQEDTQLKLREILENKEQVKELRRSIERNGWIPIDKIIVRKANVEEEIPPKYIVIEGNRRVTALKIMNFTSKIKVYEVTGTQEEIEQRSQMIMGIRHMGGMKRWGNYEKSELIRRLLGHSGFKDPDAYNDIADKLSISVREVKTLYRVNKAMEQLKTYDHGRFKDGFDPNLYSHFKRLVTSRDVKRRYKWNDDTCEFESPKVDELYSLVVGPEGNHNLRVLRDETEDTKYFIKLNDKKYSNKLENFIWEAEEFWMKNDEEEEINEEDIERPRPINYFDERTQAWRIQLSDALDTIKKASKASDLENVQISLLFKQILEHIPTFEPLYELEHVNNKLQNINNSTTKSELQERNYQNAINKIYSNLPYFDIKKKLDYILDQISSIEPRLFEDKEIKQKLIKIKERIEKIVKMIDLYNEES